MTSVADKNALKAGIFIVIALLLGLVVFFRVKGMGFSGMQAWTVRFSVSDDVSGVGAGSDVRVGGVTVGDVESVQVSEDLTSVDVLIRIPRSIAIRENPRVVVQTTITGVAWLNFDDLGDGEPMAHGSVIAGEAGTFSNLVAAANRLAPSVTGLVEDVRQQTVPELNSLLSKSGRTVDNLDSTVGRFGEAADKVGGAAASADELLKRNQEHLDVTLANLREASERAPKMIEDANALVTTWTETSRSVQTTIDDTSAELKLLIGDARALAGDARQVGEQAREATAEVRGIITGNRGKIETIINRLRDTGTTLSLAASEIRRSPWRLLYKPTGQQRDSLDLYDAARRFAEGASALQDAAVALSDAAADPTAGQAQVQALLEALQQKFQEFDKAERALYQKLGE